MIKTLNFQGQIWNSLYLAQKWSPQNKKQTYRLNSNLQVWPSDLILAITLTLNFQGQIWNLLYLAQKWSNWHETNSKHIDWVLGLKCDHRIWPWPWPWFCIFKVKFGICYISAKNGLIATKWNTHIDWTESLNDHQVWPWPWPWKVRCKDLPDSEVTLDAVNSSSSVWEIMRASWHGHFLHYWPFVRRILH